MGFPSPEQICGTQMSVAQQCSEIFEIIFPQQPIPNILGGVVTLDVKLRGSVYILGLLETITLGRLK